MNLVIKVEEFPDHYEIELQVELQCLYQSSESVDVDASYNISILFCSVLFQKTMQIQVLSVGESGTRHCMGHVVWE